MARDGVATSFPQICGVAASLNRTLWHDIGDVTSTEGRGKNNAVQSQGGGILDLGLILTGVSTLLSLPPMRATDATALWHGCDPPRTDVD